jgi:RNA polymerase sigma-70 factor (ECF subfamily)
LAAAREQSRKREDSALDGGGITTGRHSGSASAETRDDERLFARVRAGDLDAFQQLYRTYHPRLGRFLTNLLHRPQVVEEVFNDTMLVVWTRPDSFRGASRLSTWIFAIAYRKALKALRRRDEPVEDVEADNRISPEAGPEETLGQRQLHEVLVDAMARLSADHRAVVDLTYFHQLGYREIAEIMNCPVDTVKTRMFHARRHLKRLLAGELADWL